MTKKKTSVVDTETGEVFDNTPLHITDGLGMPNQPAVYTALSARHRPKNNEVNNDPSSTVPGQSMTVADMIKRHRKGLPIDQSKGALYQGEELLPDLSTMDLIDRQAYIDSVADELVEIKMRIQASAKTQKEKDIIDKIDKEVRIRLKQMADNQKDRNQITDLDQDK